jgi:hypothetical protein
VRAKAWEHVFRVSVIPTTAQPSRLPRIVTQTRPAKVPPFGSIVGHVTTGKSLRCCVVQEEEGRKIRRSDGIVDDGMGQGGGRSGGRMINISSKIALLS